jgi:hypothetical protein
MVLDAIRKFFSGTGEPRDRDALYVYVKCERCGTPVMIRVDKRHDLHRNYDTGGYTLRKEVMDGTCFNLFHFTMEFDPRYNVVSREIEGGEFITWEEYRDLTTPTEGSTAEG